MSKKAILIVHPVFILSCLFATLSARELLPLNNNWQLQSAALLDADDAAISSTDFQPNNWYSIHVPSTVLAALVDNGVYENPYYGLNLKNIPGFRQGRWLAMRKDSPFYPSWWYRRSFNLPENFRGKNISLHLDGVNYQANVWLNGRKIADSSAVKGMFRRFELDITDQANIAGDNVVAVQVFAPGHIADIPYRTKQVQATTGWDDHNPQPPDLNMGLWRKVYLTASGPIKLRYPYVATDLPLPSLDSADLTISAELTNVTDHPVSGELSGRIENIRFSKAVDLAAGETKTVVFTPEEFPQLTLEHPRLWWPNPVGPQNLYDLLLDVQVDGESSDSDSLRFGVREVSTAINDGGWRGYMVNGKNVLIRGGAWMSSDMLLRLTPQRYEALIRYAREANLNMLRSEGFSIRETNEFYDLCDTYGVMVTQQIFGRSIPDEELAVANVKDMLLRIRNHPSLVHFLGHDETFPTARLDSAYRALIAEYTPERSYQPHSGAFDIEKRFKTGGTRTGTLELWTYAPPSHYYRHKKDGAWGFAQSGGIGGVVAPLQSMLKIMPEKDLWPPFNETFSFHTVLQGVHYFDEFFDAMRARYGEADGIKDFCAKGQAMNYASARGMYEAYGRNKFDALGITAWKYDAAWPAALTWQYVDWFLNVGGAYYGAKKACEPLHIQYAYDDDGVYVVNSLLRGFEKLQASATIYNLDMSKKFAKSAVVSVAANDKTQAFIIDFPDDVSKTFFLSLKLENADGALVSDNFYWLSTTPYVEGKKREKAIQNGAQRWHVFAAAPKSQPDFTALAALPKVKLETSYSVNKQGQENVATVNIRNPSSTLAFMVHLSITRGVAGESVLPVYWNDNYFSLLPGESKTVRANFSNENFAREKAVVKIDGWNVE